MTNFADLVKNGVLMIVHIYAKVDTIIDVGAGVSVLIDNLLDKGYKNLSLLEFSPIAIQTVKNRLKNHLGHVTFYKCIEFQVNSFDSY
jgi:16S rRNA G1207 methylase RsmC